MTLGKRCDYSLPRCHSKATFAVSGVLTGRPHTFYSCRKHLPVFEARGMKRNLQVGHSTGTTDEPFWGPWYGN